MNFDVERNYAYVIKKFNNIIVSSIFNIYVEY